MDIRGADDGARLKEMIDRAIMSIATSIPAVVDSFDSSTMTVSVIPALQMKIRVNGVDSWLPLPKIVNVPAIIYGGGGFFCTIPIAQGDNCLLCFSQRAIDNWHDQGGIQPAGDDDEPGIRHHDMTDAFALFSPLPLTSVLSDYSTSALELRNTDGSVKISINDSDVTITSGTSIISVKNDGNITITGTLVTVTGDLAVTGNISSTGIISDATTTLVSMRTTYDNHTHSYTDDGAPANTGAPSGLMG